MQTLLEALRRLAVARDPVGSGPAQISDVAAQLETPLQIVVKHDQTLPIDTDALQAIFTHLSQNALAHGAKTLTLTGIPSGVRVADDGAGIAPGNRDRIFEPFFTTRRATGGTGMGLAVVKTMLSAAGGEIALEDADTGTTFRITFH